MRVLSLFSGGVGAMDIGLEEAGMEIVGQVEIDPWRRDRLAEVWPRVKRLADIRDVAGDEFGPVDLVAGGPPCQPVSSAGRRMGDADERWLWPEFFRVVRAVRPRYVLMENPTGLFDAIAGSPGGGLGIVLSELAACGYDAEWDCIPAAAFGAPHLRDRVWILAYPDEGGGSAEREQQQAPRPPVFAGGGAVQVGDPTTPRRKGRTGERGARSRRIPALTGSGRSNGGTQAVADANPDGGDAWRKDHAPEGARRRHAHRGSECECVAYSDAIEEVWAAIAWGQRNPWEVEPAVGRVVDGPSRGLREQTRRRWIEALGDSQVWVIPYWIGLRIMATEGRA